MQLPIERLIDVSMDHLPIEVTTAPTVDIVEKSMGTLGPWQIKICLLIFLVKFPVAWHQLGMVFLAPPVDFYCVDNTTDKCSKNCSQHVFDDSTFTNTIQTQWDLVCERAYLSDLTQTIVMLGIFCGNFIFGIFSDKFGRRDALIWAVAFQAITGTAAAFTPWFWLFITMRFLAAASTGGTMNTSFVMIMELIGAKKRTTMGLLYQIPFSLGYLLMPLFAYFQRDWRYFQLAISLPSIILISYYFIMPESPRWLLTVGKTDEAIVVMEKVAKHNKLEPSTIRKDVESFCKQNMSSNSSGNFWDLFTNPTLRLRTVCLCFNWLVCGVCFFGISQYMGKLGGNIFINVALSAAIELPGTFISMWWMHSYGRRFCLALANLIAGASFLFLVAVPQDSKWGWVQTALGTIGTCGIWISFMVVYIFSGELFPTIVRNVGVGTASMCARVGSMVAPFITGLTASGVWIPPVVFGVFPLVGAVLCFWLPETLNCTLPDSIEEAENFGKKEPKETASGHIPI